jgi:hypothetical protein
MELRDKAWAALAPACEPSLSPIHTIHPTNNPNGSGGACGVERGPAHDVLSLASNHRTTAFRARHEAPTLAVWPQELQAKMRQKDVIEEEIGAISEYLEDDLPTSREPRPPEQRHHARKGANNGGCWQSQGVPGLHGGLVDREGFPRPRPRLYCESQPSLSPLSTPLLTVSPSLHHCSIASPPPRGLVPQHPPMSINPPIHPPRHCWTLPGLTWTCMPSAPRGSASHVSLPCRVPFRLSMPAS